MPKEFANSLLEVLVAMPFAVISTIFMSLCYNAYLENKGAANSRESKPKHLLSIVSVGIFAILLIIGFYPFIAGNLGYRFGETGSAVVLSGVLTMVTAIFYSSIEIVSRSSVSKSNLVSYKVLIKSFLFSYLLVLSEKDFDGYWDTVIPMITAALPLAIEVVSRLREKHQSIEANHPPVPAMSGQGSQE